ncbi:MAG: S1 RNA-binding domain-containing protein [Firmicutes bacterium]|nr:S1 RNA-binding domain-containing protein [Bacillota bacterium]
MDKKEEFNMDLIEQSFQSYRVGAVVNATVVGKNDKGLVVNIGGKSDGLIAGEGEEEFMNLAKGTKLDVVIQTSRAEEGLIKVSAKKAIDVVEKNLQIPDIKKGAKFDAVVESANNSGLTAFFGAYKVFVPASEVEEFYVRDLARYKGKTLTFIATDFDEEKKQIIASRKAHMKVDKEKSQELFWHSIFVNKLVTGRVVRITAFGAFVNVDGVDCLVHNSESTHDRTKSAKDVFEVGTEYQFRVISVDRESGRVQLSHKATAPHPFDEKVGALEHGAEYEVEITKILPYGALAKLPNGLEGMIHISEMSNNYIQSVHEVVKVGDRVTARLLGVDEERRKISLSLRTPQENETME